MRLLWAAACGATGLVLFPVPQVPAMVFLLFLVNALVMCAQLLGVIQYIASILPLLPPHSTQTNFQSVLVVHKVSAIELFYFSISGLLGSGVAVFYACFGSGWLALTWVGVALTSAAVCWGQWATFQWARMAYTALGDVNDE